MVSGVINGTQMSRVVHRYILKRVYRSAVTGRFVTKAYALENPDTTVLSVVRRPHYIWKAV